MQKIKNPHAVALANKRWAKTSKAERKEIGRQLHIAKKKKSKNKSK